MNISLPFTLILFLTKYLISKINISLFCIIYIYIRARAHICFILYTRERYDFFVYDIDIQKATDK